MKHPILLLMIIILGISLCGTNRMVAEWEPQRGTLICYPFGIPSALVNALAEHDTLYILVINNTAYNSALSTLSHWNTNLNNCRFVFAPTNSHWTRDWGPQSVFIDDETMGIVDPIFNGYPWVPGREDDHYRPSEDDDVNQILCSYLGVPRVPFAAYLTGGNVMYDGYGTAFSTAQMINENFSLMNSDAFLALAQNVLGVQNYYFTINPELYGIQHIDCWAKLLDEETVLVKQLPPEHPEFSRAENIAQQFAQTTSIWNKPYRVIRIYCPTYSDNYAAAYTNSYILNGRVYVPLFNITSDAAAIQTYQDAIPGYEVIGFPWTDWYYYDALHCRVMGIADGEMLRMTHSPPQVTTFLVNGEYSPEVRIKSYGQYQLTTGELSCYYRVRPATEWQSTGLIPADLPLFYRASLSGLDSGQVLEYFFSASDASGRSASAPHNAPHRYYQTTIACITSLPQSVPPAPKLHLFPNPSRGLITIKWDNAPRSAYTIRLYNLKGQLVHKETTSELNQSAEISISVLSSGIYIYTLTTDDLFSELISSGKILLLRQP